MIELRTLNGENIDVNSTAITIELNNSLFNDGAVFKGSFSYPISLALSPNNIRLFKFANHLEVASKIVNIPVYVRVGCSVYKKALLQLSVGESTFEGTLKMDIGSISDSIRITKLTEVPFKSHFLRGGDVLKKNMLDAAKNKNWQVIPYTFLPVFNPNFCGESTDKKTPDNNSSINVYGVNGFDLPVWGVGGLNGTQIVPYFYLSYVLAELTKWLGFSLKGDFQTHPDVERIVIYNLNSTFMGEMIIAANDHLPPISIGDFFKSLCAFFCCRIKVDASKKEIDISWKKSIFIKPTYHNWHDKLIAITHHQLFDSEGYTLSCPIDGGDDQQPVDKIRIGSGKKKIETNAGTLQFVEKKLENGNWKIPVDNRAGNISDPMFSRLSNYRIIEKRASFPLRFLFTEGIVNGYPKCTSDGAFFSLKMSGDSGLFEYAHKQWFQKTFESKILKARFLLTENDLNRLDDEDIIHLKSESGVTVACLIKKLTCTSYQDQNRFIAEAEMVVLDSAILNHDQKNEIKEQRVSAEVNPDTGVFIRLDINNAVIDNRARELKNITHVFLKVYADRSCTIPLTPTNLIVYITQTQISDELRAPLATPSAPVQQRFVVNQASVSIHADSIMYGAPSYGRPPSKPRNLSPKYEFKINKSLEYTIVP